MADFDFSSFSLIHLELKGNVFIRSRSFLTKPNLRSWWYKSVAVFRQKPFDTPHPFWHHIPVSIHRRVPPASQQLDCQLVRIKLLVRIKTCFKYKVFNHKISCLIVKTSVSISKIIKCICKLLFVRVVTSKTATSHLFNQKTSTLHTYLFY